MPAQRPVAEEYGGFYVLTDVRQRTVNGGFVATERGTVAIDAMYEEEDVRNLLEQVRAVGAPPVRYVLLTHAHRDHIGGLSAYGDAQILAHRRSAAILDELQGDRPTVPLQFEGGFTLCLGESELEIEHVGGHAPDLCVIHIPARRSLWASDLVFAGRPPFLPPGVDLETWKQSLRRLRAREPQTVIPGHGPAGGPELLDQQLEWFHRLESKLAAMQARGFDVDSALRELITTFQLPERTHPGYRLLVERFFQAG